MVFRRRGLLNAHKLVEAGRSSISKTFCHPLFWLALMGKTRTPFLFPKQTFDELLDNLKFIIHLEKSLAHLINHLLRLRNSGLITLINIRNRIGADQAMGL